MRERASRLEVIGFEWRTGTKKTGTTFETKFKDLIDYRDAHGHVNVPCNNGMNNPHKNLGRWVKAVRLRKQKLDERLAAATPQSSHVKDYLTPERIKASFARVGNYAGGWRAFVLLTIPSIISF